ncbi:MAG: SRPBCC family protein [Acidimicrobiia bacterium]|nr:SRPBCC family protein [Acidimicrobiia bacterium]MDH3517823.1 SRPBCC family protein [Acidimicrobiia bacterium]
MQLSNTFEVKRPVDTVWAAFADVTSVAQCLPGASVTADKGDGAYEGSVQIKLGPMTAKFEGSATVTRDDATKAGHIDGKGVDRSGGSRGSVKVDYQVTAAEGGSAVTVDANISLSGAIAQFGRTGLIEEITKRLIDEFVECLEAKMAASTVEEAEAIQAGEVKGFTLFLSGLMSWIGKFFKRLFGGGK